MKDGLYKVHFRTARGEGFGLITLFGGKIRGGDGGLYYVGDYVVENGVFTADVVTYKHSSQPDFVPLFGVDNVHIRLKGASDDATATVVGTVKEFPGVSFDATMTKLCE